MHELSIALSLIDVATRSLPNDAAKPVAVHVRIGALSGVVTQSLLSAWELARLDSQFSESQLVIEEVPVTAYCAACATERSIVSLQQFACSVCGSPATETVRGRELDLVALELDS